MKRACVNLAYTLYDHTTHSPCPEYGRLMPSNDEIYANTPKLGEISTMFKVFLADLRRMRVQFV